MREGEGRMIYAMSDIHGNYELMEERITQLRPLLANTDDRLLLLGDFIDRGNKSYQCLQMAYDFEKELGSDKIINIKGNHELWFEQFLFEGNEFWLELDGDFFTSGTFLAKDEYHELNCKPDREQRIAYMKDCIMNNHKDLINWMKGLRLFYETESQIFVHAGVDENVSESELCLADMSKEVLTGKFPPSKGYFFKDIIAGHVSASFVAGKRNHKGIYYDGASHFYIDGSMARNGRLLCLAYDEQRKEYYELMEDGSYKSIDKHIV